MKTCLDFEVRVHLVGVIGLADVKSHVLYWLTENAFSTWNVDDNSVLWLFLEDSANYLPS